MKGFIMPKEEKTELLVVVSKVKKYVKEEHGMSTSATALEALTEAIKNSCDQAAETAAADNRKTIMDRDF
jgi:histone H3/H4